MEKLTYTTGINFSSFIALNRNLDDRILGDSKLFLLLVYIALRVNRGGKTEIDPFSSLQLNTGEFIIGRLSTIGKIDLTESEYKRCYKKLQKMSIIQIIKITNKYTLCKWLENEFIDLNLEHSIDQQNIQQNTSGSTTNNNINNTNNLSSLINLFINKYISNKNNDTYKQYEYVLKGYIDNKGVELKGKEVMDCLFVIKKMFDSERTPKQIVDFIQWLKLVENKEEYPWVRNWTLNTVQKKLPEYLAGKLKIKTQEDEYVRYR